MTGEGPPDVVLVVGPASHLDLQWEDPEFRRAGERFASFARVLSFDRRGTGLSDPLDCAWTLDQQMDDLDVVLEAAGMERVGLFGAVEAGLCAMYAATHPDRVSALLLANVAVSGRSFADDERREQMLEMIENHWGEGRFVTLFAPSRASDPRFAEWWTRFERTCVSPAMARHMIDLLVRSDLAGVLPAVRVPTLVLHQRDNPLIPLEAGQEVAGLIPGARFVAAPGTDSWSWPGGDELEAPDEARGIELQVEGEVLDVDGAASTLATLVAQQLHELGIVRCEPERVVVEMRWGLGTVLVRLLRQGDAECGPDALAGRVADRQRLAVDGVERQRDEIWVQ